MKHSDVRVGHEFKTSSGNRWRCTDIGRRTIVAIRLDPVELTVKEHGETRSLRLTQAEAEPEGWFLGPPYKVAEYVFDEYDLEDCEPVVIERDDPFTTFREWASPADEKAFEILKQIEASIAETHRELRAFVETPPASDPEFERQMAVARRIMRERRDALRQLAQGDTMESELKVRAASLVTDRGRVEVMSATEELQRISQSIHAFGVFQDLACPRAALATAREAIERAEKILADAQQWPTPEDYNAA
jgi:hypothetical protein